MGKMNTRCGIPVFVSNRTKRFSGVLVCLFGFAVTVHADTVAINPDRDNTLYESLSGALSNGQGEYLFAGRTAQPTGSLRRALIRFDIAGSVPAGATINSVVLTLEMSRTPTLDDEWIELRRLSADWGEGTSDAGGEEGNGAPSTPGDATWIHAFFSTQLWSSIGGDYASTVSAATPVGPLGTYTWGSTPQMVADVQSWLDDPANNFGWILMGNESIQGTAKRFNSRENLNAATRPLLTVTFTPAPVVPAAGAWSLVILVLLLASAAVVLIRRRTPA